MQKINSNTILILGDSTSMSIGLECKTHPFILSEREIWPANSTIINSSLPGMTAADAAAFYFRHKKDLLKDLRAVLIYLGNCDTTSTEVRKGKYGKLNQLKDQLRESLGKMPAKTSIKNRLLHFEWNNSFNPNIEFPEHPEDFGFNIERVIKDCNNNSIPAIIVRPKANLFFPSGIGKGNFAFYRYLGINEKISHQITIPDNRFKEALKFQESGEFEKAATTYKEILFKPSTFPMSQEYALLVTNNFAIAKAESGKFGEALYILNLLLREAGLRKEIVLYNIAQIKKQEGFQAEYSKFLNESYEADTSLYRVRAPYIDAIDKISFTYPKIKIVDMFSIMPEHQYLDHCHPLPEGQIILANHIAKSFKDSGVFGACKAQIENVLYNPELANGNKSSFHNYFKSFAPFTESQIKEQIVEIKKIVNGKKDVSFSEFGFASREIKTAIEYYLKHPIFTSIADVLHNPPIYPSDIGRFPEYFIIRHLIPYLRMHESYKEFESKLNNGSGILRSSLQFLSILPEGVEKLVEKTNPIFDREYEEKRFLLIIEKIRNLLLAHLIVGNQVFNRTKATIFWYVRETLRFGSHSRYSMRYDRLLLEFIAEGLAVAEVLNKELDFKKDSEINDLIQILNKTVEVHEEFCQKFSLKEDSTELLKEYDLNLKKLQFQLQN